MSIEMNNISDTSKKLGLKSFLFLVIQVHLFLRCDGFENAIEAGSEMS